MRPLRKNHGLSGRSLPGVFSRNIYEDNLVFSYFAPITTILYRQWVKDNKKLPLEDLIATATSLVCGGLGECMKG